MQSQSKNTSVDPCQMSRFRNPKMSRLPKDKMSHGKVYMFPASFPSQELNLFSRKGAKQ